MINTFVFTWFSKNSIVKSNLLESCAKIAMVHGISMQSCPKTMNTRGKKSNHMENKIMFSTHSKTPTMTRGNTQYIPAFAIKSRGTRTQTNTPNTDNTHFELRNKHINQS